MNHSHCVAAAVIAASLALIPGVSSGETLLRWKFEAGQQFDLQLNQQTASTITVAGKTTKTTVETRLELRWKVDSVDDSGAKITQQVERIEMQLQPAGMEPVVYDSNSKAKPVGQAKGIAASVAPLIGAKFQVVMNDLGEITSAEPVAELREALAKEQSTATGRGQLFSPESIGRLLRQTLVVLPKKAVEEGATWTTTNVAPGPLGKFEQQIHYTAAGSMQRGEAAVEKIDFTAAFALPASQTPASKLKVKEQAHSGTIYFAPDIGRVTEAEQTQRLVTETPYRDATIVVELETEMKSTLSPAKN